MRVLFLAVGGNQHGGPPGGPSLLEVNGHSSSTMRPKPPLFSGGRQRGRRGR